MKHRQLLVLGLLLAGLTSYAQTVSVRELKGTVDSLSVLLEQKTTAAGKLTLKKAVKRGTVLDLYFDNSLREFPWREGQVEWFRNTAGTLLPESLKNLSIGTIKSKNTNVEEFVTPELQFNGKPLLYKYRYNSPDRNERLVRRVGAREYPKGMSGRTVALWQSHGRYFDAETGLWSWQRPVMNRTVEDMYTQSYVLPYLIPMLENAGAYVITPRERDIQRHEVVADNDPSYQGLRAADERKAGTYSEKGGWIDAGTGFADSRRYWRLEDNPFIEGSARMAECTGGEATASARWTFGAPEKGEYAVYVSYKTFPESSECARYTVKHLGGTTEFTVNQKMGGGTWIYLGTFPFSPDCGEVILDNGTPKGFTFSPGSVITADAVRIGGGMGKVIRGNEDVPQDEWETSGMPCYAEGALYSMVWSGIDTTLTGQWDGDYTRDFASRGAWTSLMCGGSSRNPQQDGKGIPVDLSLGFHSDAGVTPNDSIVGTLAIYTLLCENSDQLPDGKNRAVGRLFSDLVQSQICNDVRRQIYPEWQRRGIWDKSYSECRTTGVPGMLLELLSHQNFADMRLGLDPDFRFTVSRAVYKGMLKFLSEMFGESYIVQPLPVNSMAVRFDGDKAQISWKPVIDSIEATAAPKGYVLYTRIDDGVFDNGRTIKAEEIAGGRLACSTEINRGHMYSFKIAAFNDGGLSFPSEILSIALPEGACSDTVLVVNNFDRISAPVWFDSPAYAGFDGGIDSGVPYIRDISYMGEDYQHRRDMQFVSSRNPGFGASREDMACSVIAGNTFDFPAAHGRALLESGHAFCSISHSAWEDDPMFCSGASAVDIICGKQVTTPIGNGAEGYRFEVFNERLRKAIGAVTAKGCGIIISGSYIATDVWDKLYPSVPIACSDECKTWVESTFGYKLCTGFGSTSGNVICVKNKPVDFRGAVPAFIFNQEFSSGIYRVESPDGLNPAGKKATVLMRYQDTMAPAAISFEGDKWKTVSFGFPLETITDENVLRAVLNKSVAFCRKK